MQSSLVKRCPFGGLISFAEQFGAIRVDMFNLATIRGVTFFLVYLSNIKYSGLGG